jgi:predicted ATPase
LQAAAELLDDFRDGVFFVPLAPIREPQLVASTIAQALGIKEQGERLPAEQLKVYLHEKQALLVLDNFEQVAPAAPLIAELLAAAPGLKAIVTSREALHLYGEREYGVPPLSMPDLKRLPPIERLTQYEAVRLFIERAQAVRPDFAVTAENAPAIAEVCARLDGLPLAIELAAARSKLFPPRAMLARLDRRLALLTGGPRDLPARQQTLRDAIAWSYDLLDAAEQAIFARLGVFVGGCTLAAAEAVVGDNGETDTEVSVFIAQEAVLDGLSSLVDKSLVKQIEGVGDEPRFVMLETIREYALDRLVTSDEEDVVRQRHAAYVLGLTEAADLQWTGAAQQAWLDRLGIEYDNVRAALEWFKANEDYEHLARLSAALTWFWWIHGPLSEAGSWTEQVLRSRSHLSAPTLAKALVECYVLPLPTTEWSRLMGESIAIYRELDDRCGLAYALTRLGGGLYFGGNDVDAQAPLEEALALSRTIGHKPVTAEALTGLGQIALAQGDSVRATTLLEESLLLYRELGNTYETSTVLNYLGDAARLLGDYTRATALFAESLALRQEMGDRRGSAAMLLNLGMVAVAQGDITRAIALLAESLDIFRELGWQQGIGWALFGLGMVAYAIGRAEHVARLLGAEEVLRETLDYQIWPTWRAEHDRTVAAARAALSEEAFGAAWAAGRALPPEQAITEALRVSEPAGS